MYTQRKGQEKVVNDLKTAQGVPDPQSPVSPFYRGGGKPREGQ